MSRAKKISVLAFTLLIISLLAPLSWAAPNMVLGTDQGIAGEDVTLLLNFTSNGEAVAAISDDITFDPAVLTFKSAKIGAAASSVSKSIYSNLLSSNVLRIGIFGIMNVNTIPDGVVAKLTFTINTPVSGGTTILQHAPSASDALAERIDVTGVNGSINVQLLLTPLAGSHGALVPSTPVRVNYGASQTFSINPDPHYHIAGVLVDGSSQVPQPTYTFTAVSSNHTIAASFAIDQYTLKASASGHGSISPPGDMVVDYGTEIVFTFTPDSHCHISSLVVDGVPISNPGTSYTFTNVAAAHTISVTFAVDQVTIKASAGEHGSISPSGDVLVDYGAEQKFAFTPDANYRVVSVVVDETPISNPEASYTFTNVIAPHTLFVTFAINQNIIKASAEEHGTISPSGDVLVDYESDQAFTITPNGGYRIKDLKVDGTSLGAQGSYTFYKVIEPHSIEASFLSEPVADAGSAVQQVDENTQVTLSGSNSYNPDGGTLTYSWKQLSGPTVELLPGDGPAEVTFLSPDVAPESSILEFELTVTNLAGLTDTDTCEVVVVDLNLPPVAKIKTRTKVDEGAAVTLDGTGSTDDEDGIVSYEWTQILATGEKPVVLDTPDQAMTTFEAPEVGPEGRTLTFQLKVTDAGDLWGKNTCTINVIWVNERPVPDAGGNQTVKEGSKVWLDGSASHDPDDGLATYKWKQLTGKTVTLSSPTSAKTSFVAPEVLPAGAKLKFRLTVYDHHGLHRYDDCTVSVDSVNKPPVVNTIADGPPKGIGKVNTAYEFTIKASDPDKDKLDYRFKWGDKAETGWIKNASASHEWTSPGIYFVYAQVRDESGELSLWKKKLVKITK